MTKEELLKPRIKILADWPGVAGLVKAGDVIPVDDEFEDDMFWIAGEPFLIDKIRDYPHLFREMNWCEERDEKDMPEYVSYISLSLKDKFGDDESKTRKFVKITSWHKDKFGEWYFNKSPFSSLCKSHLPATKEEYEQYLSLQKQQS